MTREELLKNEIVTDRKINDYLKTMSFTEMSHFMSENSKVIKNSSGEDVLTFLAYIDDNGNLVKMLEASEEEQIKMADKQTEYKDALFNDKKELKKLEKTIRRFSRMENLFRKVSEREERENKLSKEEKYHLIKYRRYRTTLAVLLTCTLFISVINLLKYFDIYTISTTNPWYTLLSLVTSVVQLITIFNVITELWENNINKG